MHKLKSSYIKLTQKNRLHECPFPIIALTGSIATGKSTLNNILQQHGLQIIDADKLVKEIYSLKQSIEFIKSCVPHAITNEIIQFKILREIFFNDQVIANKIEAYIYGLMPKAFMDAANRLDFTKADFIIYDVPLLFEKNLLPKVDDFILCYASEEAQVERLCKRDQIDIELAQKIIKTQMNIELKKSKSTLIVDNSFELKNLESQAQGLIQQLTI